jgi:DNA-nicking Smr family endonuclease
MSRRRLSDEERAIWKGFARGVRPLRPFSNDKETGASDAPDRELTRSRRGIGNEPLKPKIQQQPPALAQFDRRLRQRVARGHTKIALRLDLHGMTQQQAHAALLRFLHRAQAEDAKLALVVTGKGLGAVSSSASERGVLRRQVPLWLSLPEFRRFIVSFEQAQSAHGGEGALYLRLRRRAR